MSLVRLMLESIARKDTTLCMERRTYDSYFAVQMLH